MRWLAVLALAGCASQAAPTGPLVASSARLPPPVPVDPGVRGAGYLTPVAAQLQPRWGDFLEDCRLRLPRNHPLNTTTLAATFDLAVSKRGAIVERKQVETSGNGDFDTAIADVLADASPLPPPPDELLSDDELAHLRLVELPLRGVADSLLSRGELERAARRIAAAPASRPDRAEATERTM